VTLELTPGCRRSYNQRGQSTTNVTLHLPLDGEWAISFGGENEFSRQRVGLLLKRGCRLYAEINVDSTSLDCDPDS
jgi:hypothetical protein